MSIGLDSRLPDHAAIPKTIFRSGGAPRSWRKKIGAAVEQVPDFEHYGAWTNAVTKARPELQLSHQWHTLAAVLRHKTPSDDVVPRRAASEHRKRPDAIQPLNRTSTAEPSSGSTVEGKTARRQDINRSNNWLNVSTSKQAALSNSPTMSDSELRRLAKLTVSETHNQVDSRNSKSDQSKKSAPRLLTRSERKGAASSERQTHSAPNILPNGLSHPQQTKAWREHLCQRAVATLQRQADKSSVDHSNFAEEAAPKVMNGTVQRFSDQIKAPIGPPILSNQVLRNYTKISEPGISEVHRAKLYSVTVQEANEATGSEVTSDLPETRFWKTALQRSEDGLPNNDGSRSGPFSASQHVNSRNNGSNVTSTDLAKQSKTGRTKNRQGFANGTVEPTQAATTLEPLAAPQGESPTALGAATVRDGSLQDQLDSAAELNGLAANLKRILDTEARRHGIDI